MNHVANPLIQPMSEGPASPVSVGMTGAGRCPNASGTHYSAGVFPVPRSDIGASVKDE